MAKKYKIGIQVVETYNMHVIVEAESEKEAQERVEAAWEADDSGYFYDQVTYTPDDQRSDFFACGEASEQDIRMYDSIEKYEEE